MLDRCGGRVEGALLLLLVGLLRRMMRRGLVGGGLDGELLIVWLSDVALWRVQGAFIFLASLIKIMNERSAVGRFDVWW